MTTPKLLRTVRPASVAAAALVVALTGCGGDDGEGSKAPSKPGAASEKSGKPGLSKVDRRKERALSRKARIVNRDRKRIAAEQSKGAGQALLRLPPKQRSKGVGKIVDVVLVLFGLQGSKVTISQGGTNVTVIVPKALVCKRTGPTTERAFAKRVREGAPVVRRVRLVVADDARPLGQYRRAACRPRPLPGGPTGGGGAGRVVYERTGTGIVETGVFEVRSKRWTVDWRNDASYFQIFVFKSDSKKPEEGFVSSNKAEAGSKTYRGPGRFRLKIGGAAGWQVRVRDGA